MKHYGLLGEHLSHSYSRMIHSYLYQAFHLDADYQLLECKEEELSDYIKKLKNKEFHGFNVTIPYKKTIMKYIDVLDEKAKKIGSVNTIYLKGQQVIGTNTDYDGFLETLMAYHIDVNQKDCYILGTGGASLAVCQVLKDLKARCFFVSRTPKDQMLGYQELEHRKMDVLINTTPVGMYPHIEQSPVSEKIAKKAKVVMDIIFNPLQTKFLQSANSTINGMVMLIKQAMKAEEIWNGIKIEQGLEEVSQFIGEITSLEELWSIVKNLCVKKEENGRSGDEVYNFDDKYILKISTDSQRLLREKEKIDWLYLQQIPGAKSILYLEHNAKFYYLRTYVQGDSLIAERFLNDPPLLIQVLKNVITTLRGLDDKQCPYDSLDSKGNDFVHGDLCLPNILVNERNEWVGFIDLDNAGLGDCWYDYAWLLWSLTYNLKTCKWNQVLLDALHIEFNEEKYKQYIPREYIEEIE